MTTWTTVTPNTSTYNGIASISDGYVVLGYVIDFYIDATADWSTVTPVTTTWAAAA